jgi:hypothetical protein
VSQIDGDVQQTASVFAKAIVQQVLTDEEVSRSVSAFLRGLLETPALREATLVFLAETLQSEETKKQLQEALLRVLSDPSIRAMAIDLVQNLVRDPSTTLSVLELVAWVLRDESTQRKLHDVVKELLHEVLQDEALRQVAGDALRSTVTYSVTPAFFRCVFPHRCVRRVPVLLFARVTGVVGSCQRHLCAKRTGRWYSGYDFAAATQCCEPATEPR